MRRISVGELVLRSKYTLPGRTAWIKPLSPSATACTSGGPGNEVNTTSLVSITCWGVSAQAAPASRCSPTASRLMSCTTSSWPPLSTFIAIPEPIVPRPINPTFMWSPCQIRDCPRLPPHPVDLQTRYGSDHTLFGQHFDLLGRHPEQLAVHVVV